MATHSSPTASSPMAVAERPASSVAVHRHGQDTGGRRGRAPARRHQVASYRGRVPEAVAPVVRRLLDPESSSTRTSRPTPTGRATSSGSTTGWFEERGRVVLKLHNGGRDLEGVARPARQRAKAATQADRVPRLPDRSRTGPDQESRRVPAGHIQWSDRTTSRRSTGRLPFASSNSSPTREKRAATLKHLGGRKLNDSLGILMLPHGVQGWLRIAMPSRRSSRSTSVWRSAILAPHPWCWAA